MMESKYWQGNGRPDYFKKPTIKIHKRWRKKMLLLAEHSVKGGRGYVNTTQLVTFAQKITFLIFGFNRFSDL